MGDGAPPRSRRTRRRRPVWPGSTSGEGDLEAAAERYATIVAAVPLPEYVIALGRHPGSDAADARTRPRASTSPGSEIELFQANGVVVDIDLALSRPTTATRRRALELATAGWRRTPTIRAADAVAWALHRLGRDDEAAPMAAKATALGARGAAACGTTPGRSRRRSATTQPRAATSRAPWPPTRAFPRPARPRLDACWATLDD